MTDKNKEAPAAEPVKFARWKRLAAWLPDAADVAMSTGIVLLLLTNYRVSPTFATLTLLAYSLLLKYIYLRRIEIEGQLRLYEFIAKVMERQSQGVAFALPPGLMEMIHARLHPDEEDDPDDSEAPDGPAPEKPN